MDRRADALVTGQQLTAGCAEKFRFGIGQRIRHVAAGEHFSLAATIRLRGMGVMSPERL